MGKILLWILSFFKVETITGPDGTPYLRRYHIWNKKWCRRKIYIHNILRSDYDRDLHDHPWNFVSIILKGGYKEYNRIQVGDKFENVAKDWPRFSIIHHKAPEAHRLELERPCWTIVFLGPKIRDWGFYTAKGWVHNIGYIKDKFGEDFMM